ncbi:hypothetical protein MHO82_11295 [Vibrio sp. Of7-15]|uniref:hypothetical protein n=1 Tax=Vibrio sp. Of7-15 TaxID=2724879 RepID=UPI001EF186CD|nr:hypothetical protein [Vibrio sp. Of7-15]MCG7497452.1 hypothetical protein [Vibrio sp. Of7-15]
MLHLTVFVLAVHGCIIFLLHVLELLTGVPELNFLSDYFFYSLLTQWILGLFFMVSSPGKLNYLKHSPLKATRMAAAMAEDSKEDKQTLSVDMSLSSKLFLSGFLSLLICLVL